MKIAIAGIGYVGLSLAILMAQNHEVVAIDINEERIKQLNNKKSPIKDNEIEKYLSQKELNLRATSDWREAITGASFVVVSVPTNYEEDKKYFDTSAVEDIIKKVIEVQSNNPEQEITIVVKSTIPVGFIKQMREKYGVKNIFFSPEFLREGKALYDNLYPSRIIIGSDSEGAHQFAGLLLEGAIKKDVPVKYVGEIEAEAIKLFANTFLALRIAFFNEVDTFAEEKGLRAGDIIESICLDPRIGMYYNNPSFGFGGYCLPKDTKQLLINYDGVPQTMISAVIEANKIRKKYIADKIIAKNPKLVGIYRLNMKAGSDNFRESAVQDIINMLKEAKVPVVIYEPTIKEDTFGEYNVENDIEKFKSESEIILANRLDGNLSDVMDKVNTRDLYSEN